MLFQIRPGPVKYREAVQQKKKQYVTACQNQLAQLKENLEEIRLFTVNY